MTIRPDRYRNAIVPHIYVDGASDGIAFYKRAFGTIAFEKTALVVVFSPSLGVERAINIWFRD